MQKICTSHIISNAIDMKCDQFGSSVYAMWGFVNLNNDTPQTAPETTIERKKTQVSSVDVRKRTLTDRPRDNSDSSDDENISVPREFIERQIEVFNSLKRACAQQRHILQEFGLTELGTELDQGSSDEECIAEERTSSRMQIRTMPRMPSMGEGGVFSPPSRPGGKHEENKRPNGKPAADGLGGGISSNGNDSVDVNREVLITESGHGPSAVGS